MLSPWTILELVQFDHKKGKTAQTPNEPKNFSRDQESSREPLEAHIVEKLAQTTWYITLVMHECYHGADGNHVHE